MNLGDGLWGAGASEAKSVARAAYEHAVAGGRPHELNVATSCQANVLASCGQHKEARRLYGEALATAEQAKWIWDELYGRLYRTLLLAEFEELPPTALIEQADAAAAHGYVYIESVARGYAAMLAVERDHDVALACEVLDVLAGSWVPAGTAYAAAAVYLSGSRALRREALEALASARARCQGMKGRPMFLVRVCELVRESADTPTTIRQAVDQWSARYAE